MDEEGELLGLLPHQPKWTLEANACPSTPASAAAMLRRSAPFERLATRTLFVPFDFAGEAELARFVDALGACSHRPTDLGFACGPHMQPAVFAAAARCKLARLVSTYCPLELEGLAHLSSLLRSPQCAV